MGKLDGKVAIITGASNGIGRVATGIFAKEGAKLILTGRRTGPGEEIANEIKQNGYEAQFVSADISIETDIIRMVESAISSYGRLDILYNNAAIVHRPATVTSMSMVEWQKTMAINLTGTWLAMKYAIPEMIKTSGGSIINTSSIAALVGVPNQVAYGASKGGVISMTRVAAVECAPKNVRVNCIAPGPVFTPMLGGFYGDNGVRHLKSMNPRNVLGKMEEVAKVALFLASDDAAHIIGQVIVIDGGHTIDSHIRL